MVTPPRDTPGVSTPAAINPYDAARPTTKQGIQRAIRTSKRPLATGLDDLFYALIDNTMKADANILTSLFNGLLHHSVFPPTWKPAKCMPIPTPGRTDLSILKHLRPISLLSCLSKTFKKILTQRITWAGKLTGAISPNYFGSTAGLSAIDTHMMTLTPAQEWLLEPAKQCKSSKGPTPMRLSVLAKDIEGAFNCVVHERMVQIMTHYKLSRRLVATITHFNSNREMCMSIDGETEPTTAVACSLPQGTTLAYPKCTSQDKKAS